MRAQGKAPAEIAALLNKPLSAVREVLGVTGQGKPAGPPATARKVEAASDRPSRRSSSPDSEGAKPLGARARLIEPHAPRVPRVILDQGALQAAALAFAAGEVTKDELMRRISR